MHPSKVQRSSMRDLTDLPNVGEAVAGDLRLLGIEHPDQLKGRDAWEMYDDLCRLTRMRHDPCMIDVFLSITRFVEGDDPQPWWNYTEERKRALFTKEVNS